MTLPYKADKAPDPLGFGGKLYQFLSFSSLKWCRRIRSRVMR